jgi:glucose/arabinose dehydrogenase
VRAIHFFTREGKQRGEFLSYVEVSALAFAPGNRYPTLGDSLFVCESHRYDKESPGVLRRIVFAGDSQITADDLIVKDCKGDVETSPDGTVYYSTATQILRLLPPATGAASEPAAASPTR